MRQSTPARSHCAWLVLVLACTGTNGPATVHALRRPAISILAEEPDAFRESIPRRRTDLPALTVLPRWRRRARLWAVICPDGPMTAWCEPGQTLLSGGYELQGAEPPAPPETTTDEGRADTAPSGVRGHLSPDGPTRPKWRCRSVRLDCGAEHCRWRRWTSHRLRPRVPENPLPHRPRSRFRPTKGVAGHQKPPCRRIGRVDAN